MKTPEENNDERLLCLRILNDEFSHTIKAMYLEDEQVRLVLNAMQALITKCHESNIKKKYTDEEIINIAEAIKKKLS
jgi:hypothetical protein